MITIIATQEEKGSTSQITIHNFRIQRKYFTTEIPENFTAEYKEAIAKNFEDAERVDSNVLLNVGIDIISDTIRPLRPHNDNV